MKAHFSFLFVLILLNILIVQRTFSQNSARKIINSENVFSKIDSVYGADQRLVSGIFFENIYRNDLGYPYLFSNEFSKEYIIYRNKKYENINLKYNVFEQTILLYIISPDNESLIFTPANNYISEFTLRDKVFHKYKFTGSDPQFFQVVYDGEIKCLYFWYKKREESYKQQRYANFNYLNEKKKKFLVIKNNLYRYNTRRNFIQIFPKKYKKEISKYIKTNKLKFNHVSDQQMTKLVTFCESLTYYGQENNSSKIDK